MPGKKDKLLEVEFVGDYKPDDVIDRYNFLKEELRLGRFVVLDMESGIEGHNIKLDVKDVYFRQGRLYIKGKRV